MTYRELIAAIYTAGPVVVTTMAANSCIYVEVIKADLVHQLKTQAAGDLDQPSEWTIEAAHDRKYLEAV